MRNPRITSILDWCISVSTRSEKFNVWGEEFILIKSKISFRDRHKINCFLHQKSTWADTEIQHFSEHGTRFNLLHQTPPSLSAEI